MAETKPQVYVVAQTEINYDALKAYTDTVTNGEYKPYKTGSSEDLIIAAGKTCYRSWKPKLNPNVTRVREDPKEYIANILRVGHGSVLEHVNVTFLIANVSRAFTHELVRHRTGTAFSQESLRYVLLEDIDYNVPAILKMRECEEGVELYKDTMNELSGIQKKLAKIYNTTLKGKSFYLKKLLTSAFRRLAPMGTLTTLMFTTNLRNLRHLILLRTSQHADQEIRWVFNDIANHAVQLYPNVFQDFYTEEIKTFDTLTEGIPEWKCKNALQPYDSLEKE